MWTPSTSQSQGTRGLLLRTHPMQACQGFPGPIRTVGWARGLTRAAMHTACQGLVHMEEAEALMSAVPLRMDTMRASRTVPPHMEARGQVPRGLAGMAEVPMGRLLVGQHMVEGISPGVEVATVGAGMAAVAARPGVLTAVPPVVPPVAAMALHRGLATAAARGMERMEGAVQAEAPMASQPPCTGTACPDGSDASRPKLECHCMLDVFPEMHSRILPGCAP